MIKSRMRAVNALAKVYGSILGLSLTAVYMHDVLKANLADIGVILFLVASTTALLTSSITFNDEDNIR